MNNINKIVSLILLITISFTLIACKRLDSEIYTAMSYSMYEYNITDQSTGIEIDNTNINVGKRYKIVFDLSFSNLESSLGDGSIAVTMTVQLGTFDNNDNRTLQDQKKSEGGGWNFNSKGNGKYEGNFRLNKNGTTIDYGATYFIVGVDTLGIDPNNANYQKITVSFSAEGKEFLINSQDSYEFELSPIKGNYTFNMTNITSELGINAPKTNISIIIPNFNGELLISIFSDDTKSKRYGETQFLETDPNYTASFEAKKLNIVLSDLMKEYVGNERYSEWVLGGFDVYIVITAKGGNNYNDATVELPYSFEG